MQYKESKADMKNVMSDRSLKASRWREIKKGNKFKTYSKVN